MEGTCNTEASVPSPRSVENKQFKGKTITDTKIKNTANSEFTNCSFTNILFQHLSGCQFTSCGFHGCVFQKKQLH